MTSPNNGASQMDDSTREALLGSIAKWKAIVDGTGYDQGTRNCPLCKKFYNLEGEDWRGRYWGRCFGCPVVEEVGKAGCENTPYNFWVRNRLEGRCHNGRAWIIDESNPRSKLAAQDELAFLQSLLSEDSE